jgi:hypothetical protein
MRRNNSGKDETIFGFWRITEETAHGYQRHNDHGAPPANGTWR